MLESGSGSLSQSEILSHFRRRVGHGRGQHLHDVAHDLIGKILLRYDSRDTESLISFCANADNLRPWLRSEADRIVFAAGLVEGLREISLLGR